MTPRIVILHSRTGRQLFGMLDEPLAGQDVRIAALLLSPGLKTRVGPHRLYRKLATAFLSRGMPVLRLDLEGFGDSEGEPGTDRLEEIYRAVEFGGYAADVSPALDWLEDRLGVSRIIVGGLCGAAITGLHAAARDPRIAGLYAIGFPVTLHSAPTPNRASLSQGEMRSRREIYLRKLFEPVAWLRLLSLKSDFIQMLRVLRGRAAPSGAAPDLNPSIAPAFEALFAHNRPALLIFGERDRLRFDYEEKFAQPYAATLAAYGGRLQVEIIAGTNHVLGDPASVAEALSHTGAWLDRHFAAASTVITDFRQWQRTGPDPAAA